MVNSVYNYLSNYYMSTYGSRPSTRFDSHKRNELRNVYQQMIQYNKETPYYKINLSSNVQNYAIDVKETSRDLQNAISSISGDDGSLDIFQKKQLYSTSPDAVSVSYTGQPSEADYDTTVHLQVQNLASTQVNTGNFLSSKASNVSGQTYSFSVGIHNASYEFEFYVSPGETNLDIQNRLAKLFNQSDIGITARVITNDRHQSAICLESSATGTPQKGALLFSISSSQEEFSRSLITTLGLDQVSQYPKDALFYVDGEAVSTHGNSFTIDQKYQVTLAPDAALSGTITIGFQKDTDSIRSDIENYVSSYNSMVQFASRNTKLFYDINSVTRNYRNELEVIGLDLQEDGTISINDSLLKQAILEDDASENFSELSNMNHALTSRLHYIQMDPLHYVDKLMVSYPNPGKTYPSPYVPSHYSGMIFNFYC